LSSNTGTVLVAGAGGRLGGHLLKELAARGHSTRALVRDASRFERESADELFVAEARVPSMLKGACEGVACVVSAMGASLAMYRLPGGAHYDEVDLGANLNLLAEARAAGVEKFVYVSLYGAERLRGLAYVDAHEEFVAALAASGLDYAVVRPTGFFYVFGEIFKMAANGRAIVVGDGGARTNPIHEADVARACADACDPSARALAVGGPETYTRREIAELAFAALGQPPRITHIRAGVGRVMVTPSRFLDRRLYDLFQFGLAASTTDLVAPPYGSASLAAYFRELAGREPGVRAAR